MMAAYQITQRGANGLADLPVSGTVKLFGRTPASIQARFRGGPWVTVDASPSASAFSGTLPQQSGQGLLEVRYGDGPLTEITAQASYVGVGDVFCVAGQSNATGQPGADIQAYSHDTLKAGAFYKDYAWRHLTDPLGRGPFTDAAAAEYTDSTGGTVWPVIATAIMANQGVPVGYVPCAKGGTMISEWAPGADHRDRTTLYGQMIYRCEQVGGVKAVLWWQGESDSIDGRTTKAQYKTALQAFGDAVYADLGCPVIACTFLLCSTAFPGSTGTLEQQAAICDAIRECWGTHHILAGPDLHDIPADDPFHAIYTATIATCAARWWTAIQAALYA